MTVAAAERATRRWATARPALGAAIGGWVGARLLVGAAVVISGLIVNRGVDDPLARSTQHQGLLAWDGSFYADIAAHGYVPLRREALRFFPLSPLLGRAVGWVGVGPRVGVVIVANIAALVAGALLWVLVRREGFGDAGAKRAAWFLALMPSSFVLVFGYAESVYLALAIGIFITVRERRWWIAAALAVPAGLSRPGGFIITVAIAIEAGRSLNGVRPREAMARAAAVLAPFLGAGLFLWWVGNRFGDPFLPFRVQTRSNLKGAFGSPVTSITHAVRGLVHGHVGTGLHVPWMIVAVVLTVVAFRRLPASYGWFSAVTLASAVTSSNIDSFERYALSAFPLVIVVAIIVKDRYPQRAMFALSSAAMTGYAVLALLHAYVP